MSALTGPIGSISGLVHVTARRPVLAATIVLAAVAVAYVPKTPPPPPTPPPPAVVLSAPPFAADSVAEPAPVSQESKSYTCEFGKATAPTNLCKAQLDSIALFLQNDSAATVKVTGSMNHALAVRKYFTEGESKLGIRSDRIEIDSDGRDRDESGVTIEQIP